MHPWPVGWSVTGVGGVVHGAAARQKANLRPAPTPTPRVEAEARALKFAAGHGSGAFKRVSRAQVAAGLLVRIVDPNQIAQGQSSLCGPAALVRSVAFVVPVAYVDYVTHLFEFGHAALRNLRVEAGEDLRDYDPATKLNHADWVALASLRDSENYFFDYQAVENELAGITLPSHMERWFHKVGFSEVINDTNLIIDKSVDNIIAADNLYRRNYWVCLLISANMLSADKMSNGSMSADHWVVLTSRVRIMAGNISFSVFSWGKGAYLVPQGIGVLSVDDFLDNYYGYVAAKY